MNPSIVAHLLLSLLVVVGCTKSNPDYCDVDDDCARGLICHVPSHACIIPADAGVDDSIADARHCFGPPPFQVCVRELPTMGVTLPSYTDTDHDSELCSSEQLWQDLGQKDACFVVGTSITVSNTRIEGSRQLVLIATGSIDVIGYVDASAHSFPFMSGPGVPVGCGSYERAPQDSNGAGGGAGASFRTGSGHGGDGGGDGSLALGGRKNPVQPVPLVLRAGCPGQTGGNGPGNPGAGGGGGGAVYLAASTTIRLASSAIINVSGAAGTSSGVSCGGGGGGSGGMILLDAPAIIVDAGSKLVANGGGGSAGGSSTSAGAFGKDPDPTQPFVPAAGGQTGGASGGQGGTQTAPSVAGTSGLDRDGGGGGGGGLGYIRSNHPLTNAEASPEPHIVP